MCTTPYFVHRNRLIGIKQINCHDSLITCKPHASRESLGVGENMRKLDISDGLKCMAMGHQHYVHDGYDLMKGQGRRKTCHAYNAILDTNALLTSTRSMTYGITSMVLHLRVISLCNNGQQRF